MQPVCDHLDFPVTGFHISAKTGVAIPGDPCVVAVEFVPFPRNARAKAVGIWVGARVPVVELFVVPAARRVENGSAVEGVLDLRAVNLVIIARTASAAAGAAGAAAIGAATAAAVRLRTAPLAEVPRCGARR